MESDVLTRKEQLLYVAGLFDGEGCIGLYNTRTKNDTRSVCYQLVVRLTQKTPQGVEALQELWDGNIYTYANVGPNKPGPYYAYRLTNRNAEAALKELIPFLRNKQSQALMAIEFCDLRRAQSLAAKREKRKVTDKELALRDDYLVRIKAEKRLNYGLDHFN